MDSVILISDNSGDFAELSNSHIKPSGKLYKKMIFRYGSFSHPKNPNIKINVDKQFYLDLKKNFEAGVCPIVQFPLVNEKNEHVENPDSNLGQVMDLSDDEEGVYAYIDVRKHQEDIGSTILGASAKVHLNYTDRKTGQTVGPTLIHVAATNNPFLTDLSPFETVAASNSDTTEEVVLLTNSGDSTETPSSEEEYMTQDELIAALSDMGIDVKAGQDALAQVEGFVALSDVIEADAVTPESISQVIVDLSNTVNERNEQIEVLTAELQTIKLSAAETEVDKYIEEGRILPAWRDKMIDLSATDRATFETFLLPEDYAKAELSELGTTSAESSFEEDPAARAKARGEALARNIQKSVKED